MLTAASGVGESSQPGAARQQKRRRQRAAPAADEEMLVEAPATPRGSRRGGNSQGKVMTTLVKQVLKLSQRERDISGTIFDTFLLPTDAVESTKMMEQTGAYGKAVADKGKSHDYGPPHIWAYGGLIAALLSRGPSVGAMNYQKLTEHMQRLETMTVDEKCDAIMYCRLDKTWVQEQRRITLAIRDPELRRVVLDSLVQSGATRKTGRAPRSGMERELEAWLENLRL